MKKQTVYTLLIIAFVLSFFVTPLGDYSKILLNRWFATSPTIIKLENRGKLANYNWELKDAEWNFFNFDQSQGSVVFISFWTSWHLPSKAQLKDIQALFDEYKGKVDFYIITNEERLPVEEFMAKNGYDFPVTYQVIGNPSPIEILKPPGSYIIDKNGYIAVHQTAIADWDNDTVRTLLDNLISAE
ncbi:TlpA family protein disulfide reductase [Costertonia aggregata]|uniref:TlpA family protein disulfide reductase n=1 Tax=Costertonia aggregata TaxID=343403 RepID=A0A7H9AL42_9FLAO|nr:TlpA disulfide reductase family protein [Costertonia aggregata]QLG44168.1 TlpA family protein disulfide reductase [Costertonia aggregata]